jgi:hypothetical protein
MATTRGLVGIFAGRSVNLVVLQSVNKFPSRYFHKCVECGRIYSSTFTAIGVLKNFATATQRKSCVCDMYEVNLYTMDYFFIRRS